MPNPTPAKVAIDSRVYKNVGISVTYDTAAEYPSQADVSQILIDFDGPSPNVEITTDGRIYVRFPLQR